MWMVLDNGARLYGMDCINGRISNYSKLHSIFRYKTEKNKNKVMRTINVEIKTQEERDNLIKELQQMEFKKEVKSWKDLEKVEGYWVDDESDIQYHYDTTDSCNRNFWATEEQAKASIAMAQLSQLMKYYNGDWVADWEDRNQIKYTLHLDKNKIGRHATRDINEFLTFKTSEIRDTFLENHRDLIEQAKPLL